MKPLRKNRIISIDPSPNGTAVTYYVGNHLVDYIFSTDAIKRAKKYGKHAILIPEVTQGDENARMERLTVVKGRVLEFIDQYRVDAIAIEDYIWNTHGQSGGIIQLTELGGVLRLELWERDYRIRTVEPMGVKISWTGSGNAKKKEMMDLAREALIGSTYEKELCKLPQKEFNNVADAIALASLLNYELDMRRGLTLLRDMPERVRRVMQRTTKAVPDCMIDRPFMDRFAEAT